MVKTIKQVLVIAFFGVLIVGAVSVSGFYRPAGKKLLGKWHVSFNVTEQDFEQLGVTHNPLATATAQTLASAMQAEMAVEFLSDGTIRVDMTTLGFMVGQTGTWEVAEKDGQQLILKTQFADNKAKSWKLQFLDDDTFQMESPQDSLFPVDELIVFRRVKEDQQS